MVERMGTGSSLLALLLLCRAAVGFDVAVGPNRTHTIGPDFFSLTADSSAFSLEAHNSTVSKLAALERFLVGLAPLTIRVGGTLTDMQTFPSGPAPGSPRSPQHVWDMDSWALINQITARLPGSQLVVSVSGLQRHWNQTGVPWDPTNAESFVRANLALGYDRIAAYELGNEPGCWNSHGGAVTPAQHALDFGQLRAVIARAYAGRRPLPMVIGPDTTNCGGDVFNATIAHHPDIDVATVHLYSVVPTSSLQDFVAASRSSAMCQRAQGALAELRRSLGGIPLWNGEGGASYLYPPAGGYLHQYGGALALLNNLGCLSAVGVAKMLKHDLFENIFSSEPDPAPTPTFWAAYVFKRLVAWNAGQPGSAGVMPVKLEGADSGIHVYAFTQSAADETNVLMALNLINVSESFRSPLLPCQHTRVYSLSPHQATGQRVDESEPVWPWNAAEMQLNGQVLAMQANQTFPDLQAWAIPLPCGASVTVPAFSGVFLVNA